MTAAAPAARDDGRLCAAGHINQRRLATCQACRADMADELGVPVARVEAEMRR